MKRVLGFLVVASSMVSAVAVAAQPHATHLASSQMAAVAGSGGLCDFVAGAGLVFALAGAAAGPVGVAVGIAGAVYGTFFC